MSSAKVNPIPDGARSITQKLVCDGATDAVVAQAARAGAKITMPPSDMFWGDRYATLEDPFGHHWSVATHVRDLTPEQIVRAMNGQGEDK